MKAIDLMANTYTTRVSKLRLHPLGSHAPARTPRTLAALALPLLGGQKATGYAQGIHPPSWLTFRSGKGTPRRKVKKVHKSAGTDDKKLQTALKKLNTQPIQAIEEVNMFKSDGNVIHFSAPKGTSHHLCMVLAGIPFQHAMTGPRT